MNDAGSLSGGCVDDENREPFLFAERPQPAELGYPVPGPQLDLFALCFPGTHR
jgi:hypothetical protein